MAKEQYKYVEVQIPATPRNKRLTDSIQHAAQTGSGGGGYGGGGGSISVDADFDIQSGEGIEVSRTTEGALIYTIGHGRVSAGESTENKDDVFVQNIELDHFGHVTSVKSIRISASLDDRYLRKDIDDTAHGNISFDRNINSTIFIDGFEGKGWKIWNDGSSIFDSINVRQNIFVGNRVGSPEFISGFPNGFGWDLSPYKRINAAEVEETKYRLEIDDIIVRGKLRVFEMIISQLRGENDNVIFAGMMKVDHYDKASKRIYLDTDEGVIYNPFRSGDILMVQRFGGLPSAGNNYNVIKQYELRVTDAGVGSLTDGEKRLDWITFSNFVGDLEDIAEGDVLTRVDSVTDSTRKGVVKITTIDEIGAPYIDVVYGMKTDPENATKVRIGNLTAIRTKSGIDLTDIWGIYANGAFIENSTYILNNGNTVEQEFSVLNGKLESTIGEIRNDMSLESGNILVNSTFSQNMNYWEAGGIVHFLAFSGVFLITNGEFMSEKDAIADIYQDGNRNVLRIRKSSVIQKNEVMDIPVHEETEEGEYTYSFSFYYKVLTSGTLTAGIEGSDLYVNESLSPTEDYVKMGHVGKWNETGDFKIAFTGEILIYGVSLFNDALADAEIRLQTQITQNAEAIKLTASKEYVDSETGKIYTKYDAEFKVTAEQISQRVTKEEFDSETGKLEQKFQTSLSLKADIAELNAFHDEYDEFENLVRRDYATQQWTSTQIQTEVGTYVDGELQNYTTITQTSQMIQAKVEGLASMTEVEQALDYFQIQVNEKIEDVEGAFYKFDSTRMMLNRRIETGTGSSTSNFTCQAGMSPNRGDNVAFWAGGTYSQAVSNTAKLVLRHDGSGFLAGNNINWNTAGDATFKGTIKSEESGNRLIIQPGSNDKLVMYNSSGTRIARFYFESASDGTFGAFELTGSSSNKVLLSTAGLSMRGIQINPTIGLYFNPSYLITQSNINSATYPRGTVYCDTNDGNRLKVKL